MGLYTPLSRPKPYAVSGATANTTASPLSWSSHARRKALTASARRASGVAGGRSARTRRRAEEAGRRQAAGVRRITGDLTVRGVTRQVTVDFELTGSGRDPQGSQVAAFTGRTVIDRRDRGVSGARGMVGRKVTLEFRVAAVRRS
ncbi:YceI family protein [Streptomyces massasporeus]|uniref:YceI family protein n=1 Tax=Streptomyces massasporeus TaxID=67324 RepID=A0ABW6LH38_9ACTN